MRQYNFGLCGPALFLVGLVTVLVLAGCDGSPTNGGPADETDYLIRGMFTKDLNLHSCRARAVLHRDDSLLATADVALFDRALSYEQNAYSLEVEPEGAFPPDEYHLSLVDSTLFADSIEIVVTEAPDSLRVEPPNRINAGGGQVSLYWSLSASADGYVVAAVPRYMAYFGHGFSLWVNDVQATMETIPPDAFRWSNGIDPDTGWYYLYVYAYTGSPDSVASTSLLPVPLPGDRLYNVQEDRLTGRFGTVTVALRDSVNVTVE